MKKNTSEKITLELMDLAKLLDIPNGALNIEMTYAYTPSRVVLTYNMPQVEVPIPNKI